MGTARAGPRSPEFDDERYGRYGYARTLSALDCEIESFVGHLPDDTVVVLHGDHGESITWRASRVRTLLRAAIRRKLRYERGYDTRALERVIERVADLVGDHPVPDRFLDNGHGETVSDSTTNVPFLVARPDGRS